MRKSILILICLLCASPVLAQEQLARINVGVLGGGVAVVVAGCSTPAGTILSESFGDGAGDTDETWGTNGDSYTYKHELQAGAPTGSCTYGLLHDTSNESTEMVYWDNGENIVYGDTSIDITFSFYLNSATIDNNANILLLSWGTSNAGTTYTGSFRIFNSSGQLKLYGTSGASDTTKVNISVELWYLCTLHLDTTAASSYLQVVGQGSTTCDAAAECSFTRNDTSGRYLVIGSVANEGAAEAISFEIGYVTIN